MLKEEVETFFHQLGLSTTEAINIFYKQVQLRKGLPFNVVMPNKTTEKTFKDTDAEKSLSRCQSVDDMFDKRVLRYFFRHIPGSLGAISKEC